MLMMLATIFLSAAAAVGASQSVDIRDMRFDPGTVTIHVGDTVEWKNTDDRDHTITASDGSFDSGNLSSGASFRHTFKSAGKYSYKCSYHPRMKGVVVVEE